MSACPTCTNDKPRPGQPILCRSCASRLRLDLARIPGYLIRLEERLVARGAKGQPLVTGTRDPGINLDTSVVQVRGQLLACVQSWSRVVAEDREVTPPRPAATTCCAFLLRHLDWTLQQLWVDEFASEINGLVRQAHARIVPPRPMQFAGGCDQLLDDAAPCPGNVLVDPERRTATCDRCGVRTDAEAHWARVFAAVDDDWLATATEASRLLALRDGIDLRPERIRQWASRGRVTARAGDAAAVPLYRLGDLLDLLDDTPLERPA